MLPYAPANRKHFPFQIEGIEEMASRKHTLLADFMGAGKSCQIIGLINSRGVRRSLIICPASVKLNWLRELRDWLLSPEQLYIQILNKKTDTVEPWAEIIIVNYDLITHSNLFGQLSQIDFDLLVCDEAHYLKNMKAKRTIAVLAKNGLVHRAKRTVMATGTPVLNRPIELYPILKVLAPQVIAPYGDYFRFAKRYCDAWQDGFSLNVNGASHTDELNEKLRKHYMIRRMASEVYKELPKVRYQVLFVEQTAGVKASLKVLDDADRRDFQHQKLNIDAGGLATLRRETADKKVDACIERIRDIVDQAGKIVIFAYHHSVMDRLEKELKEYGTVSLSGSHSQRQRQDAIQKFSTDPGTRVFIGQIQAAGQGIDGLQKCCSNVLFLESSWVPGEISQAIARVARIGQTKPVLVQFLIWADSVEEHLMRVALDKVQVIKEITK